VEHLRKYTAPKEQAVRVAEMDTKYLESKVEALVAHKFMGPPSKQSVRFRVRWEGWGSQYDQWKYFDDVDQLEALDVYLRDRPLLASQLGEPVPEPTRRETGVAAPHVVGLSPQRRGSVRRAPHRGGHSAPRGASPHY
jgi:hypothetical protein